MQIDVIYDDHTFLPDFFTAWDGWEPEYQNRFRIEIEERLLSKSGRDRLIALFMRAAEQLNGLGISTAELTPMHILIHANSSVGDFSVRLGQQRMITLPVTMLGDTDENLCEYVVDILSRRKRNIPET